MPTGTWVCRGTWYSQINQAPGWYERSSNFETHLYRLQLVATPDVMVECFNTTTGKVPPAGAKKEYNRITARRAVKYIPNNQLALIRRDIFWLDKLEPLASNAEMAATDEDTSDDENLESDDDVPKEVGSEDEDDEDNEN